MWPMDGHGQCADVLDGGMIARAASYHSCPLRRPLPACTMMTRKGACASVVPHAEPDMPC
jgi:hypothetical protein